MNGKIILMLFILFYHKEQVKSKKLFDNQAQTSVILSIDNDGINNNGKYFIILEINFYYFNLNSFLFFV